MSGDSRRVHLKGLSMRSQRIGSGTDLTAHATMTFRGISLACPYFIPREMVQDGAWPHPSRLPLGAGWNGVCGASAAEAVPAENHIREFCNLGYAAGCPQLPAERDWDAVRFSVAGLSEAEITLHYACERDHAPVAHGKLIYELPGGNSREPHPDRRVARLADGYVRAYRARTGSASI